MGKIIGIDLGTTNSLAAYSDNGKCVLIPNRYGEYLTPSVVCVEEDGTLAVGKAARERQLTSPELCASEFKRGMGLEKRYALGERSFSAEELSALVLKSLKEDAEAFLGEPIEEAVISVPAYFGDKARRATRKAGLLAGLKVERIVNEPSAAALSFRQMHPDSDGNILVIDFGGGTLDISLVDCFESVVEIVAVSGDNRLGGMDFDRALARAYCRQRNVLYDTLKSQIQIRLLREAERVKRQLSIEENATMNPDCEELSGNWTLSRRDLIRESADIFERIKKPVQRVLTDGKLKVKQLAGVILVGGSNKMPVVQEYIRYLLPGATIETVHPDYVIGLGVGIYAGIKESKGEANDFVLTDICPFSLGTQVYNSADPINPLMSVIIPRNSPLPSSRFDRFQTVYDNQPTINVGVYQGEELYARDNLKLADLSFGVPPAPAGEVQFLLRFTYDINGILLVDLKDNTGNERHLTLGVEEESEEITRQIEKLKQLRREPKEIEEIDLVRRRAQKLFHDLPDQEIKQKLGMRIVAFEKTLSDLHGDPFGSIKEALELKKDLDRIEQSCLPDPDGLADGYLDSFLEWYENRQEEQEDQSRSPET